MLYLIDTADIDEIQQAFDVYPLAGVTTNPTLIAKQKARFPMILSEIRAVIGPDAMLHAQVLSPGAADMVREAQELLRAVDDSLYVKIPVTAEGIKAIRILHRQGVRTTATAVFSLQQAMLAAVAGADFTAPYVNRIDNACGDGAGVVADMVKLFDVHRLATRVLAASFKNVEQVHRISLAGSQAVTLNKDILDLLLEHPLTQNSVRQFKADWEKEYGHETR